MEKNRTRIVIALGSNVNQEAHMQEARKILLKTFEDMTFGDCVWTEPIGIHSDKFLNGLAVGYTKAKKEKVNLVLKNIERRCGRTTAESHLGIIAMDIDLLLYGDERFHEDDWKRDYIQNLFKALGELK